jgi:hypothetical protein
MKKYTSLLKLILLLTAATTLIFTGCFEGNDSTTSIAGSDIVNESGGTTDGSGVSSNENIEVESGNIVVNSTEGVLAINGADLQLVVKDSDNNWVLAENITVVVTDNAGNTVTGSVSVDPDTGVITFVPDSPLTVSETYTIAVTVGEEVYEATVVLAADDTTQCESLFSSVPIVSSVSNLLDSSGIYSISLADMIVNDKALFGWEFGTPAVGFKVSLDGLVDGSEVYLTAYGVYDITGHETEIYYQRWLSGDNAGEPVKDFVWNVSEITVITVNEVDDSLDSDDNDYSFSKTYLEIKVMKDGVDITATSGVTLKVEAI